MRFCGGIEGEEEGIRKAQGMIKCMVAHQLYIKCTSIAIVRGLDGNGITLNIFLRKHGVRWKLHV